MDSSDERGPYFWTDDPDEIRRAFIIDVMSDADIDGKVLVQNMQQVFEWLRGSNAIHRSDGKIQKGKAALRQQKRPESEESSPSSGDHAQREEGVEK